jgi:hypothetical protein
MGQVLAVDVEETTSDVAVRPRGRRTGGKSAGKAAGKKGSAKPLLNAPAAASQLAGDLRLSADSTLAGQCDPVGPHGARSYGFGPDCIDAEQECGGA